ncbi:MAG: serine/threonine protein kinase [Lentisphaeria bacterium]|nr:serine/threonine protein kinase [Lentisphaeria bacterium]
MTTDNYISFTCHGCDSLIDADLRSAGLTMICPSCKESLKVPKISEEPSPVSVDTDNIDLSDIDLDEMALDLDLNFEEDDADLADQGEIPVAQVSEAKVSANVEHFEQGERYVKTPSTDDIPIAQVTEATNSANEEIFEQSERYIKPEEDEAEYEIEDTNEVYEVDAQDESTSKDFNQGDVISGFELGPLLGKGSMGEVFLANQISMDREVAFKILPTNFISENDDAIEQFVNEVRILAQLDHPNIVTAYEAGEFNNTYYLAMQYINGQSLESKIQHESVMDEVEALSYCIKVCEAMQYAWDKFNLLHRDIKPANIMIDQNDVIKVMDLGIAMVSKANAEKSEFVMGTPYYMSPEQAKGNMDLDWRSDQYAIGATLYHLVSGRTAFDGEDSMDVMVQLVNSPLIPPGSVNEDLSGYSNDLIMRMMHKDPNGRYQNWVDLITALKKTISRINQEPKSSRSKRPQMRNTKTLKNMKKQRSSGSRRPTRTYIKQGLSPITYVIVAFIIVLIFYSTIGILNASGILQNNGMTFPDGMFPGPFRAP